MKKRLDFGICLAVVTGAALLAALVVRAFLPRVILPRLDGPALVLLTLAALLLSRRPDGENRRDYRLLPLWGALVFGLLPFAAAFVAPMAALKLAILGAAVVCVTTFLFDSMLERLSTGPVAKAAPVISALGLYLAAQCLMGLF